MFGNILRNLRKDKGMTQSELADVFNISASSIRMFETQKRHPNQELLVRIANYFNVTVDYLLGIEKATPIIEDGNLVLEIIKSLMDANIPVDSKAIDVISKTVLKFHAKL